MAFAILQSNSLETDMKRGNVASTFEVHTFAYFDGNFKNSRGVKTRKSCKGENGRGSIYDHAQFGLSGSKSGNVANF